MGGCVGVGAFVPAGAWRLFCLQATDAIGCYGAGRAVTARTLS